MNQQEMEKQKQTIRSRFLDIRSSIDKESVTLANRAILEKVIRLKEYMEAEIIHIYASMSDRNEVDTFAIIDRAFSDGKSVMVPVMGENSRLIHSEITSLTELKKNDWGVPEPTVYEPVSPESADVVFVPMVAGDMHKNRMGYGRGYYDRFLANVTSPKIGLLFEDQLSDMTLPVNKYDVPLTKLVTEKRIIL